MYISHVMTTASFSLCKRRLLKHNQQITFYYFLLPKRYFERTFFGELKTIPDKQVRFFIFITQLIELGTLQLLTKLWYTRTIVYLDSVGLIINN